jgi:5-methyltetrahydropteroyltriglutamate--homocysteine methyltransferase
MQTTVVGNYPKIPNRPRPARLRQALNRRDRGEITNEELARIADEVTIEVIEEQIEAGVDIVTDGQVRWDDDQTHIMRALGGTEIGGLQRYLDTNTYYREAEIIGAITWREPILVRDFAFAAEHSQRPVKAIITGPYTLAALSQDKHYGSREKLVMALTEGLRQEVQALVASGATLIQINDPVIVFNKDDIGLFCEAISRIVEGVDAEIGVYTWFGSVTGILPQLLELPVATLGLDFVWGRENWDALKSVRYEKKLGFGIIDARNTRLESPEQISDAVKRVSELVPSERLLVNPSCGLEYLPREIAFEKLKTMVEGARRAEGVLA